MQIIKKSGKELKAKDIFVIAGTDEVGWTIDEINEVDNRFELQTSRGQTNKRFFVHPDQLVGVIVKKR